MDFFFRKKRTHTLKTMNLQSIKLDKLKETWHYSAPAKLYDLCIDTLVKNIDILLVKNEATLTKASSNNNTKLKAAIKSSGDTSNRPKHSNEEATTNQEKSSSLPHDELDNCVTLKSKNIKNPKTSSGKQRSLLLLQDGATAAPTDQNESSKSKPKAKYRHRHCHLCHTASLPPGKHKKLKSSSSHTILNRQHGSSTNPNAATTGQNSLKYLLRDSIGPIPNCICQSIIVEYSKHYLRLLEKHERDEYFLIEKNAKLTKKPDKAKRIDLINYYDLVMAMASRPDKCNINIVDYRQCIWSHSTLEQRLKLKMKNKPTVSQAWVVQKT